MTNVTTYDRPTVESAAAMKAPDMSYLGTSGAHFDQFGADDTFGGFLTTHHHQTRTGNTKGYK